MLPGSLSIGLLFLRLRQGDYLASVYCLKVFHNFVIVHALCPEPIDQISISLAVICFPSFLVIRFAYSFPCYESALISAQHDVFPAEQGAQLIEHALVPREPEGAGGKEFLPGVDGVELHRDAAGVPL